MKKIAIASILAVTSITWIACKDGDTQYYDLSSGDMILLEKDSVTGQMVNVETRKPVRLYVNTKTRDTIYGPTEKVVNNEIVLAQDGAYYYTDDEEYKLKFEDDGDYKLKVGDDYKEKYDNGEYKVKHGDYKKEVEKDGDVIIKDGKTKTKIDGETGEKTVTEDD